MRHHTEFTVCDLVLLLCKHSKLSMVHSIEEFDAPMGWLVLNPGTANCSPFSSMR